MIVIITQISIFNLLGVALERFAAIRYPFTYEKYCDTQLASYSIVVLWILAILVGVVPLFSWNLKASYNDQCSFTNTIDINYPFAAAIASIRPSWPPPRMPMVSPGATIMPLSSAARRRWRFAQRGRP